MKSIDEGIFNDHDYYQLLLNDFLANGEKNIDHTQDQNTVDQDFLYGADLSLTQKYLAKR